MAFAAINSAVMHIPAIEEAFATEPSLKKRVYDAIGSTPQHTPLFEDLARHTSALLARTVKTTSLPLVPPPSEGPVVKKRKIQNGLAEELAQAPVNVKDDVPIQFYVQDVSFAIPQRKKLTLEVTAGYSYLRARNQTTKEVEFGVPMNRIRHALCLPVPEKTQKQFNFCIVPEFADGVTPPPEGMTAFEPMVFMIPDGPAKAAFDGSGQQVGNEAGDSGEALLRKILNQNLTTTSVVRPDERQFVSAMSEAHRKNEKAYHVKAFRGSKEGYLFLLSTGILFAFKKPLLFFSFDTIDSVSYTSVLQRTFNLNILARPNGGSGDAEGETQEFEFSMIDQADFDGIDAYIKRHGLQDASLAEARRAKKYNVNGGNKGEDGAPGAGDAGEEESELQKAQQEMEDLEDEDEEDYDPGSDDGSDGSGSSSEEDSEDDDDEGVDENDEAGSDGERDLVKHELGSETEDVGHEKQ
ncbi:Histone chaperone [Penicillium diatomitis]|uniref:Histone chaperone n=1 Tax=Penicillium diatomitis TaxID=2819901 RepID=A0A9X0BP23_9EURO|nr:Histone chaperone [Penicillium diatomitis]KAJ5477187.1 Histone chaperone [Penicillium diatomitis]